MVMHPYKYRSLTLSKIFFLKAYFNNLLKNALKNLCQSKKLQVYSFMRCIRGIFTIIGHLKVALSYFTLFVLIDSWLHVRAY